MASTFPIATVLTASALLFSPVASFAETPGYYSAIPVTKPDKNSLVTTNVVWRWRDTAFVAPKAPSRDPILCEMIARQVGPLSAFTAGGQPFDTEALARCNAHAK